ncbi:MAG: ORF6N domain-containing protein [Anaerovoracaceae bacterium]
MENAIIKFSDIEKRILKIREQNVLLDVDVAVLYGTETKRINETVRNNPDKFPEGYMFELTSTEKLSVVEIFDRLQNIKYLAHSPRAFSEKGMYMLATILKSKQAIQTTFYIIETFSHLREFSRTVDAMSKEKDVEKQKHLLEKSSDILSSLMSSGEEVTESESSVELNLAVLKIKHTVKKIIK